MPALAKAVKSCGFGSWVEYRDASGRVFLCPPGADASRFKYEAGAAESIPGVEWTPPVVTYCAAVGLYALVSLALGLVPLSRIDSVTLFLVVFISNAAVALMAGLLGYVSHEWTHSRHLSGCPLRLCKIDGTGTPAVVLMREVPWTVVRHAALAPVRAGL